MSLPNFNDALKMLGDPYCSLTLRKVELHVVLHSKYIGNKEEGINEFLEWKLGIYNTQFDGVLIAYDKVRTVDNKGMVLLDKPYIHYDITGDFIVFRPTIGAIVRGQINTPNTTDYLSCIIHKCFNACITFDKNTKIPKLKKKDKILFTVDNIFNRNGVISLNGVVNRESFSNLGRKEDTAAASDLEDEVVSPITGKKIKIKKEPVNEDQEDTGFSLKSYLNSDEKSSTPISAAKTSTKKKNKKKRKSSGDSDDGGGGGVTFAEQKGDFSTPKANRSKQEMSVTPYPKHKSEDGEPMAEDRVVKKKKKKRKNDETDISNGLPDIENIKKEKDPIENQSTDSSIILSAKKDRKNKDSSASSELPLIDNIKKEKISKDTNGPETPNSLKKSKKSKKRKSADADNVVTIKIESSH